jgi:cytochrome c peroxidase
MTVLAARARIMLGALALAACGGTEPGRSDAPYTWDLPPGFPAPTVPADNPMTAAKVTLGRHLFYDRRLSQNQTQSCATCHRQARAFTDGRARGLGSTGQNHPRGSMSLANVAYASTLTWANDIVTQLERQALVPMFGETPVELGLGGHEDEMLARLRADARYQQLFPQAFPALPNPFTIDAVTKSLASFERTLISGRAPYDRYEAGLDRDAISESAKRGAALFFSERLECFHCHGGFAFADAVSHQGKAFAETTFHNTGLYNLDGRGAYPPDNTGLLAVSGKPSDMGRFKAPTLRNIAVTAPYMHDGSIATLSEVLDHYAAGGRTIPAGQPNAGVGSKNPFKSELVTGFMLTEAEKADVIQFLESLTDDGFLSDPRHADPFAASAGAP